MTIDQIDIIGDKILIKPKARDTNLEGVEIQDTARQKVEVGTVVKLGTGSYDSNGRPIQFIVQVGDKIMFDWQSGTNMTINKEQFIILECENIAGLFDDTDGD